VRHRGRLRSYVLATVLLTGTLAGAVSVTPAAAEPAPERWSTGNQAPADAGDWVTLLTGDRVYVDDDRVAIEAAAGREGVGFSQYAMDGHQYVVPNDALRLVSAGQVDRRLFDVTGLAAGGYDDASTAVLPTIVEYTDATAGAARVRAAGAQARRLSSVDGAAVRVGKGEAASFWGQVTAGKRGMAAGVERVWLDGRREISLDVSVPQIGAPAAWDAGFDGTGVTVAVLDTGVDATHPDLAGRIVEARNFTEAADTNDLVGHGTHVASTIAGTGAASGGKYRGVAPGAGLLIGKVCPDRFCSDSAILAGMEWAAPRAQVINLSLGAQDFPGIDPLEEAVNRLSAQTGALFVIAAGNEGRDTGVSTPATADAALAVAAVDKQENLAGFSNRGPRSDGAIKPDISAPGVDIVAALAKDSDYAEVSPGYTQISGTSMATPHVAGAAALVAQQHPGWASGDLKTALMASAKPNPAIALFGQGAGRVDVARATTQAVLPSVTSLALGTQAWPAEDDVPVTRTVTYRNDGSAPVTFDVTAPATGPDGNPAPAGMFTVSPGQVTVPAGGSADVTVTADTRVPSVTGAFTGALVASAASGAVVRVPLAISKGHEVRTLTIHLIDRAGAPATDYGITVWGVDQEVLRAPYNASGTVTASLRPGFRYHIQATVVTPGEGSSTLLVNPVLTLTGDMEITLDARAGKPVSITVPNPEARGRTVSAGMVRDLPSGYLASSRVINADATKLYTADLGGTVPADAGTLISEVRGFFARPTADGTFFDSPYEYDLVWFQRGRFLSGFSRTVKESELATVVNRSHAVTDGSRRGFMHNFGFPPEGGGALSAPIMYTVPGVRTIYYMANDVRWETWWNQLSPTGQSETQEFAAPVTLRAGKRYAADWQKGPSGPTLNNRTFVWRNGNTMTFNVPPFGDQAGNTGYSLLDSGRTAFYVNGTKLAEVPTYFYDATGPVPPASSTYRLEYETDRTTGFVNSTKVSGSWTFRSAEAGTDKWHAVPISSVGFAPQLDLANTAPGATAFRLPVKLTRQPGAAPSAVRRITVEVSYDDGATWRSVPLAPTGGDSWVAHLLHPRKGSVSLRASATFADGGAVDYTVIRAY
jgi:subtilisin family serine protease